MPTFDTLAAERSLTSAGIPRGHAEAIVRAVRVAVTEEVATQADLQAVRADLQAVKADLQTVRAEIKASEQRVVIRLGAAGVVLTGILFTALRLTA